jgi:hypothetical protein
MTLDLHFIPGYFSDGTDRVLAALGVEGLGEDQEGVGREVSVRGAVLPGRLRLVRAASGDRVFADLAVPLDPERGPGAMQALEIEILRLACAALAHESQGALLVGQDLGEVDASAGGTVAEQVLLRLEATGERIGLIVVAADTAARLGEIAGFQRAPLGDLVEYRRV